MRKLTVFIILFCALTNLYGQRKDYYSEGNAYLNQRKYALAEATFAEGIELDAQDHALYPCLANAMMLQGKYNSADSVLEVVLEMKPNLLGALWFKGLNYLYWDQDSMSIVFMKKYLKTADPEKHQVGKAYYYIGRAYEELLKEKGLLAAEVSEMISYYQKYILAAEGAPVVRRLTAFIAQVNAKRPKPHIGKWKYAYVPPSRKK
jgi:tetratricopeptide (TPR) repeat protein